MSVYARVVTVSRAACVWTLLASWRNSRGLSVQFAIVCHHLPLWHLHAHNTPVCVKTPQCRCVGQTKQWQKETASPVHIQYTFLASFAWSAGKRLCKGVYFEIDGEIKTAWAFAEWVTRATVIYLQTKRSYRRFSLARNSTRISCRNILMTIWRSRFDGVLALTHSKRTPGTQGGNCDNFR